MAEIPGATEVETRVGEFIEAVRAFIEKTVLETEGVEPFDPEALTPEQTAIQAVINELNAAPGTAFTLNIPGDPGTPFILQTQEHPSKYWALRLGGIVTDFNWEKLTEQEGVALLEQAEGTSPTPRSRRCTVSVRPEATPPPAIPEPGSWASTWKGPFSAGTTGAACQNICCIRNLTWSWCAATRRPPAG